MKNLFVLLICLWSVAFADEPLDTLLQTYVSDAGFVNYEAWKANAEDMATFQSFIDGLATTDTSALTGAEQLAFWINAYNTLTIREVLERYPINSVRPTFIGIPERSFFTATNHVVGGKNYSLDQIENDVIRTLGEPRIHFAINCASYSCPKLRNEAYDPRRLNGQLDEQAVAFVNDPIRNQFDAATNSAKLSKIFDWFEADFEAVGGVASFLAKFAEGEAKTVLESESLNISYIPYDWSLNKQ
jgi:Protein of unknown function, DUF547